MRGFGGFIAGLVLSVASYSFLSESFARFEGDQSSELLRYSVAPASINAEYFAFLSVSGETIGYHPAISLFLEQFPWEPEIDLDQDVLKVSTQSLFSSGFWSLQSSQYPVVHNLLAQSLIDLKDDSEFIVPTYGDFTSGYGMRWGRMHNGIDVANFVGTPVVAAQTGTVSLAGWNGGYGYTVEILHPNGLTTRYAYLSAIDVQLRQPVTKGQSIGKMGATGHSTGPHLHFEVMTSSNQYLDPVSVLSQEDLKSKFNL